MSETLKFNIQFFFLFFLSVTISEAQKIIKAVPGDSVIATIPIVRGSISWQYSLDNNTWVSIDQTSRTLKVKVNSIPVYFRAVVKEDNCEPTISEEISVLLLTTLPSIVTSSIADITTSSAKIIGSITSDGNAQITDRGIVVHTNEIPTLSNLVFNDGDGAGTFETEISGLLSNTSYFARGYATNANGTSYGNQVSFTTLASLSTPTISNLTTSEANINNFIDSGGGATISFKGIVYGTSANPTIGAVNTTQMASGSGAGPFTANLMGLVSNATYYLRTYATNAGGTTYSNEISFTTLISFGTTTTSNVTSNGATISSTISPGGAAPVVARGIVYSTNANPTIGAANTTQLANGSGTGAFDISLTGLTGNTTYYLRAYATNAGGITYSNEVSFTTLTEAGVISLGNPTVLSVSSTTASISGSVDADGGAAILARGVVYGISANPTIGAANTTQLTNGNGTGSFTSNLTGLASNTIYYLRAYATNADGTTYSNEVSFTTLAGLGIISFENANISSVSSTTASVTSTINAEGGAVVSARGIVYSTSTNPIAGSANTTQLANGSGTGPFDTNVTGLTSNTTYYLRAYATYAGGTTYGNEVSFTTLISLGTTTYSDITSSGATISSSVNAGGAAVESARGIVYSTTTNPTIGGANTPQLVNGGGTGAFNIDLTGLTSNTTYYVRSYATNAGGTTYSNEISFTTLVSFGTTTTSNATSSGAFIGSSVNAGGGVAVSARGIVYSTSTNPTIGGANTTQLANGSGTGAFNTNVTGLTSNTTYYVRSYATNAGGTSYSNEASFTTLVSFGTTTTSNATSSGATIGSSVNAGGGAVVTARGIVYGTSTNPIIGGANITQLANGSGTGAFNIDLTGLTSNTTYYVRSYATNAGGTTYGNELSFTTLVSLGSTTTSSVTSSGAAISSSVNAAGGASVSSRGIVYSTSTSPAIGGANTTQLANGIGTGAFNTILTGLTSNTTYYVRSYATNAGGTTYSNEASFTTLVSFGMTTSSNVTSSGAAIVSAIDAGGGAAVSSRGIVYSTSTSPTIGGANTTQVANGSGTGAFNTNLTNLTSNTTYYARTYATNAGGTTYSNEVSFYTLDAPILLFVSQIDTYYSEYIVVKEALEKSGYVVEVRSSSAQPATTYMAGYPNAGAIEAAANNLAGSSYSQFQTQFQNLFGTSWNGTLNDLPPTITVSGSILDVTNMNNYRGLVIAGGTGALDYRVDGVYSSQGVLSANTVESVAIKLNALALDALINGKPVMAQCHAASLPVFWRTATPALGTPGASLGTSLLQGQPVSFFPASVDGGVTQNEIDDFALPRPEDRVTIASPHSSLNDNGSGDYKIITTRDWYPQTVASAARTLVNILQSYPTLQQMAQQVDVLILHGGVVDPTNCSAANKGNDIPCNYTNAPSELPADYTHLVSLLGDSPNDNYAFNVTQVNILSGSFPTSQTDILNYLNGFDVVVFFKHWSTGVTTNLQNAIVTYVDNGGGVLALHHGAYNDVEGSLNKNILINQLFGAVSAPPPGWSATRETYQLFSTNYGHYISTYGIALDAALQAAATPGSWSTNNLTPAANSNYATFQRFSLFDERYDNMTFVAGQTFGRGVNQVIPLFSNNGSPSGQVHTSGFIKLFNISGSDVGRFAYFQPGERPETLNMNHRMGQVIRNAIVWLNLN